MAILIYYMMLNYDEKYNGHQIAQEIGAENAEHGGNRSDWPICVGISASLRLQNVRLVHRLLSPE